MIHKLEGIFLNLPKGKDKNLLWKNMGTNFFLVHNTYDCTFLIYNLKGVFFVCLLNERNEKCNNCQSYKSIKRNTGDKKLQTLSLCVMVDEIAVT